MTTQTPGCATEERDSRTDNGTGRMMPGLHIVIWLSMVWNKLYRNVVESRRPGA